MSPCSCRDPKHDYILQGRNHRSVFILTHRHNLPTPTATGQDVCLVRDRQGARMSGCSGLRSTSLAEGLVEVLFFPPSDSKTTYWLHAESSGFKELKHFNMRGWWVNHNVSVIIFLEKYHSQTDYNAHIGYSVFCFQSRRVYLGKHISG